MTAKFQTSRRSRVDQLTGADDQLRSARDRRLESLDDGQLQILQGRTQAVEKLLIGVDLNDVTALDRPHVGQLFSDRRPHARRYIGESSARESR